MVTRPDYEAEAVAAARSVLLELARILGAYRNQIVLVGGWVPALLLPDADPRHVGSLDVDLALDHRTISGVEYRTIDGLLGARGYERDPTQPFIYWRTVRASDRDIRVQVDLLAGEYEGSPRSRRTQAVQNIRPRKARGCDLALDLWQPVEVSGPLPGGAQDRETVRVAGIVPFLVMKAMAIANRVKEKDAYDIYFCTLNYPGGIDALAKEVAPLSGHGLVKEAISKIADKFRALDSFGPRAVADFQQIPAGEVRELRIRDAFERVQALLSRM